MNREFVVGAPVLGDLEAIVALMRACEEVDEGDAESTVDEVSGDWGRSGFDLGKDASLVIAPGDKVVGYIAGWPREVTRFEVRGYVHPGYRGRGIGSELLQLAESRAGNRGARVISNIVNHADRAARAILERQGYTAVRHYWQMQIEMESPPRGPEWPDGVTVRNFVRAADELVVHALIQEAFADNGAGFVATAFEDWSVIMLERESFDAGICWLAVAGDEVVGAAMCPRAEGTGWVRQLAVRRGWRRRGLAAALLQQAFGEFWRRGERCAGLVVDSYNRTGAKGVYERAGMRVQRQYDGYEKKLK